ncbi:MAG: hypothetical protein ABIW38_05735 [Ferruginibacter sp.]
MKKYFFLLLLMMVFSIVNGQQAKNAAAPKPTASNTTSVVVADWKYKVLLDTTVFKEVKLTRKGKSKTAMTLKLANMKSSELSVKYEGLMPLKTMAETVRKQFDGLRTTVPDAQGMILEQATGNKAMLTFNGEKIAPMDYLVTYYGTREQQALAAEKNKNIPVAQRVNEYSADEKNTIIRFYFLPVAPGMEKGSLIFMYSVNAKEEKDNNGLKKLQLLVDGISAMKFNEYTACSVFNSSKYKVDFALPDSTKDEGSFYSFASTHGNGNLKFTAIKDASLGYAAQAESYHSVMHVEKKRGLVEKHTLFNGINIFSLLLTMKNPVEELDIDIYEWVNVLVADNKIIHEPLMVVVNTIGHTYAESKKLNAYILNSISLPGTLRKTMLSKIKYTTKDDLTAEESKP